MQFKKRWNNNLFFTLRVGEGNEAQDQEAVAQDVVVKSHKESSPIRELSIP